MGREPIGLAFRAARGPLVLTYVAGDRLHVPRYRNMPQFVGHREALPQLRLVHSDEDFRRARSSQSTYKSIAVERSEQLSDLGASVQQASHIDGRRPVVTLHQ